MGIGRRRHARKIDPRYNKTRCFEPFPFPAASDAEQARIRGLAEQLDAHRKHQQAQHPKLTLTDMYNVLEKLQAGEPLTAKDKTVHEQGLVSILRELHDELDVAVCNAYGWPVTLADEEILARLVALNAERAVEEAQGLVRWLRPDYQAPADHASRFTQHALIQEDSPLYEVSLETRPLLPWPTRMAEQAQAVRVARWLHWADRHPPRRSPLRSQPRQPIASPSCWRRWSRWGRRDAMRMGVLSRNACSPRARTPQRDFWLANRPSQRL